MANLRDIPVLCNFTMLSSDLYNLLVQYIAGGRIRAPPESELADMVPSFQFGARTDRRALQSKFKSWSKRMKVENGTLKLVSSNKEIIPQEKCKDLVMSMHYDGHKSVTDVISQIEERYTWTKKNFGMDRYMVMDIILCNCTNFVCKESVKNEVFESEFGYLGSMIKSSETRRLRSLQHNSIPTIPIQQQVPLNPYIWPMVYPVAISDNTYGHNCKQSDFVPENKPFIFSNDVHSKLEAIKNDPNTSQVFVKPFKRTSVPRRMKSTNASTPFRKPKHIREFKALVTAAEKLSRAYPAVLNEPKTKFLSVLDLVPKKICSKNTLMKFEREKKRRKNAEKQHIKYHKCRKNLRDRNKLNKIKLKIEREKRLYLNISGSHETNLRQSDNSFNEYSPNNSKRTVSSSVGNSNMVSEDNDVEIINVVSPYKEPELIQITSSDDESNNLNRTLNCKNISSSKSPKINDCSKKTVANQNMGTLYQLLAQPKYPKNKTLAPLNIKPLNRSSSSNTSSSKNLNLMKLNSNYTTFPFMGQPLIPANIQREIAVVPPSSSQYPIFNVFNPSNAAGLPKLKFRRIAPAIGKNLHSLLKDGSKEKFPKIQTSETNHSEIGKIPSDTNIFLIQKSENGNIKKIPFKMLSATTKDFNEFKRNLKLPGMKSPIITKVSSTGSERNIYKVPFIQRNDKSQSTCSYNELINAEMSRLVLWIKTMKMTMVHTFFQHNLEKSSQKLTSQINTGIALVRSARRRLYEVEKLEKLRSKRTKK